jgi:hypothetical protein
MSALRETLQVLGALAMIAGVPLAASRRRLGRELERAHAFGPESAVPLAPRFPPARVALRRLLARGVVVKAEAGGRYYMDLAKWAADRRGRRRRALALVTILLAALLVAWAAGALA